MVYWKLLERLLLFSLSDIPTAVMRIPVTAGTITSIGRTGKTPLRRVYVGGGGADSERCSWLLCVEGVYIIQVEILGADHWHWHL